MNALTRQRLDAYEEHGFVILEGLLDAQAIGEIRDALSRYLDLGWHGRNDFEGVKTQRVYSLVGRGKLFEATVEHPDVLDMMDALLEPNYQLTASQAICIQPGETPQPVHYDDTFYPIARPRKPISVSTIWAVDDFTASNGGTAVIPGSHRWDDGRVAGSFITGAAGAQNPAFEAQLVPVEMPAGSCVVFAGTLLHRGGANRSNGARTAFSHQYCEPWARTQENWFLSIPKERAAGMSPRLQSLLGYSVHPPFMGQMAGRHPAKALAPDHVNSLVEEDDQAHNAG